MTRNRMNVVRFNNGVLYFENFQELNNKFIRLKHAGENSIILIPSDNILGDPDDYFCLTNNQTNDLNVIEFFKLHDAIDSLFDYHNGMYYQTQMKSPK